jgi:uncharacterized membrane protein YbhN (UPF0104 family)
MINPSVGPRLFDASSNRDAVLRPPSTFHRLRPVMMVGLRIMFTGTVVGWIIWNFFWDRNPARHDDNYLAVTTLIVRADRSWLVTYIGALALHAALMVFRWNLALATFGVKPGHRWAAITWARSQVVSLLPTNQLGADAYRAHCIRQKASGVLAPLAVVFLERSVGVIALITLAAIASPLAGHWRSLAISSNSAAIALVGVLACIVCITLLHGTVNKRWRHTPLVAKLASLFRQDITQRRKIVLAFFVSIAAQAVLSTSLWCVDRALNLGTPVSCYLIAMPITGIACLLPVHVAGVGVTEASLFYLLGAMAGRTLTEVVALSFLARLGSLAMIALYALTYLVSPCPKVQVHAHTPSDL